MRDYTPSKQFNSKLSLETHKRIDKLVSEHGYQTQRKAVESAIELLLTSATPNTKDEQGRAKRADKKKKEEKPPKAKCSICEGTGKFMNSNHEVKPCWKCQ